MPLLALAYCALLLTPLLQDKASPEQRAISYLANETARWPKENKCFSCHNNGDAARALYSAKRLGYAIPADALKETSAFLSDPARWTKSNQREYAIELGLARIQFAAALQAEIEAGVVKSKDAMRQAADLLVRDQKPNGSWTVDGESLVGSPVTYGPALATSMAIRVLRGVEDKQHRGALARAENWLLQLEPKTTLDAVAALEQSRQSTSPEAARQRERCLALLRKGRGDDGGWGPYATSPAEPFDTALVLLVMSRMPRSKERDEWLKQGRAYLLALQAEDGSWPATTRPAGADSYAQHISTTAWACLALLATSAR